MNRIQCLNLSVPVFVLLIVACASSTLAKDYTIIPQHTRGPDPIPEESQVAVMPFSGFNSNYGWLVAGRIETGLIKHWSVTVLDRSTIEQIVQEAQRDGVVDPDEAVKLGRANGAEFLINGTVGSTAWRGGQLNFEETMGEVHFNPVTKNYMHGKAKYLPHIEKRAASFRHVSLEIGIRIVNTESSILMHADARNFSVMDTIHAEPDGRFAMSFRPIDQLLSDIVDDAVLEFINPGSDPEKLKWEKPDVADKGKSRMKRAEGAFKNSRFDESVRHLRKLEEYVKDEDKHRAKYNYSLGLCYYCLGRYPAALYYFELAMDEKYEDLYDEMFTLALDRCEEMFEALDMEPSCEPMEPQDPGR